MKLVANMTSSIAKTADPVASNRGGQVRNGNLAIQTLVDAATRSRQRSKQYDPATENPDAGNADAFDAELRCPAASGSGLAIVKLCKSSDKTPVNIYRAGGGGDLGTRRRHRFRIGGFIPRRGNRVRFADRITSVSLKGRQAASPRAPSLENRMSKLEPLAWPLRVVAALSAFCMGLIVVGGPFALSALGRNEAGRDNAVVERAVAPSLSTACAAQARDAAPAKAEVSIVNGGGV